MMLVICFFYRKPPDRLLEISEWVYVFDCCFSTDVLDEDEYKTYMGGIVAQLQDHYADASFMVLELLHLLSPLNPQSPQLRYLQKIFWFRMAAIRYTFCLRYLVLLLHLMAGEAVGLYFASMDKTLLQQAFDGVILSFFGNGLTEMVALCWFFI
ncbi:hypothetical protein P3S67_018120 [Capsicum chacoense]